MSKSSSETQGQKKSKELWEELFSPFFTFFCAIFFPARLDFPSPQLSAPGSPRMCRNRIRYFFFFLTHLELKK